MVARHVPEISLVGSSLYVIFELYTLFAERLDLLHKLVLFVTVLAVWPPAAGAIDWPMAPRDSAQPIGNGWGEYQNYGGWPYLHPGIDIMGSPNQPVYAVKSGFVKAVLTTFEDLHWRVAIGDSAGSVECEGWLYAHLQQLSITVQEGDWVAEGELLGNLVYWPVADFHHLHFAKIRNSGVFWFPDWEFIENPLVELSNIDDFVAPAFLETPLGGILAFCQNQTSNYLSDADSLYGDVDIICRAYDLIGHPTWKCNPHRLEYLIKSDTLTTDTLLSFLFEGQLFWEDNVPVIFKDDHVLDTRGDYTMRDYYYILTNTDGDGVVEASDAACCWQTREWPNDDYMVIAKASDAYGNVTYCSMAVRTANFFAFNGTVTTSDSNPDSAGSVVRIPLFGMSDSTDEGGTYGFEDVPAGTYEVRFSRAGYLSVDTLLKFAFPVTMDIILDPASYVAGDADGSGEIDIDDVVFLIAYIFSSGPAPAPYVSGDADGSGCIDIDDVVYLIDHIFGGDVPPMR